MALQAAVPWTQAAWLEEARAWIGSELARLGIEISGPLEQPHVRPWSTVLRVPTEGGDVWFKANMPALRHEAAVLTVLRRRGPECLPRLLAVDLERGWMLQADGGRRLRDLAAAQSFSARWEELLGLYAGLQIDAAAELDELLAVGAPDRRLARVPELYARLVADRGDPRLGELVPLVSELCQELAAHGLPETIQHDDLHGGNVFVRDGGYVFFDWGDACVSHPFFSLHVTLRVLAHELGVDEGSRELDRFRDAYLEPWTRFERRSDLLRAARPADLLGGICRALGWQLVVSALPTQLRGDYADAVDDRLSAFLAATREGRARGC